MTRREAPSRLEANCAYALSALTTLLWVGCVLPGGVPADPGAGDEAATPVHRAALLVMPALLLLVIVPVGTTLARRLRGTRAVLASTDTFIALYAATALLAATPATHWATSIGIGLLFGLGGLSALEVWQCVRPAVPVERKSRLRGARLALCVLVLIVPAQFLLGGDAERLSLLVPFFFIALSAGGARLAGTMRGLRRTCAVLQLALAAHLFVTLRYTLMAGRPYLTELNRVGTITLALAVGVLALTVAQFLLFTRRGARASPA